MVDPASQETDLPTFARPPVVEVVLGMMFKPLQLGVLDLARLHEVWAADYPRIEEHPAIPTTMPPGLFIEMSGAPDLRLWFVSDSDGRLIQVQKDRVILNWRWSPQSGTYPRYEPLRDEFVKRLSEFEQFLKSTTAGPIEPVATEVTYINAIGTDSYTNFHDALNFVTAPPERLSAPVEANVNLRFETSSLIGRDSNLIVSVHRDVTRDPAPLILQISSHAQLDGIGDFSESLNKSRELVVTSFRDMTTEAMHERWGKQ